MATYTGENSATAPARSFEVVVTDTPMTKGPCRSLYVGTGGSVVAVIGGASVTFAGVQDGTILPIVCTEVETSGTTASNMIALY